MKSETKKHILQYPVRLFAKGLPIGIDRVTSEAWGVKRTICAHCLSGSSKLARVLTSCVPRPLAARLEASEASPV